jgi:low temperature requirement protein LtrA
VTDGRGGSLRQWLWSPPRGHGEVVTDRSVSFLELFYDLVYVAVISRAAHHLADHVTARGFLEFTVVFGLIWTAWVNGTLYLELHGREDGRTRTTVFLQMAILVLLAVFAADATGESGTAFALVYALFLAVMTWLWYSVRRQDRDDHPEFLAAAGRYVAGMAISVLVIVASAFLPDGPRLAVWAAFCVAWLAGVVLIGHSSVIDNRGLPPTDSLVERFGLFTIIVLGEVIFGVVNGLSDPDRDVKIVVTGMVALGIGFGFWWVYFDLVGRRMPRADGGPLVAWMLSHLPITLSIAASGAAMVSLISHATDARTPTATAWLLTGSVALGLLAVTVTDQALVDADRLAAVYRPLKVAMAGAAAAALAVGWARPAPWLLALLLDVILSVLWVFAASRFLRADAWGRKE